MTDSTGTTFRILVVCTGNICRSPQGERLLAAEFARQGLAAEVSVSSAGTAALVGNPMEPQAAAETARRGGNPSAHVARRLAEPMVNEADLVLTMERAHRADVVRMLPRANRFAFTLPEFARLVVDLRDSGEAAPSVPSASVADRLRALIPQVAAGRGMSAPVSAQQDEVEDPYRRSDEVYARSATYVASLVSTSVTELVDLAGVARHG